MVLEKKEGKMSNDEAVIENVFSTVTVSDRVRNVCLQHLSI